jgi:phospholipid/cholesterol/gamma-HCH transport system ATP-binding protein
VIELIDLHKQFDSHTVLDGVNLRVENSETMVVLGGSGGGKSVMLRHIVGLYKPDRGQVLVDGVDVAKAEGPVLEAVRQKFGMLFQSGALINWLSVEDNVALPLREVAHMPEKDVRERVRQTLELVNMQSAAKVMPAELSGGMKRRAALARAIVRRPQIILYDEPTSDLDPVLANHINELILDMKRKLGVTSLVVTHDMNSAFMVGDRIAMLYKGKIVQVGTPDEIRMTQNPIVRQFIDGKASGPLTS